MQQTLETIPRSKNGETEQDWTKKLYLYNLRWLKKWKAESLELSIDPKKRNILNLDLLKKPRKN